MQPYVWRLADRAPTPARATVSGVQGGAVASAHAAPAHAARGGDAVALDEPARVKVRAHVAPGAGETRRTRVVGVGADQVGWCGEGGWVKNEKHRTAASLSSPPHLLSLSHSPSSLWRPPSRSTASGCA